MSSEIFYSDLVEQIPEELFYGRLVRSKGKSGKIEKIRFKNQEFVSENEIRLFPFSEIFPDYDGLIHYEGEPIALLVSKNERFLVEENFQDEIEISLSFGEATAPTSIEKIHSNIEENDAEKWKEFDFLLSDSSENENTIIEERWSCGINEFSCRETEGALAFFNGTNLNILSPFRHEEELSSQLENLLGLERDRIIITKTCLHQKNSNSYYYKMLTAKLASFAAVRMKKAVIVALSRKEQEEFVENPCQVVSKIKTVLNPEGKILAADIDISADLGYYCIFAENLLEDFLSKAFGFYDAEIFRIRASANLSLEPPRAIDISMIDSQIFFGIENQIQKIADTMGISPATLRIKNLRRNEDSNEAEFSPENVADSMKKLCEPLDNCVKVKLENFETTDLNKCEIIPYDEDFTPTVFDRKWSSFRLTNQMNSFLSENTTLRGTALSFSFKETNAEGYSGTAFALCSMQVEVNPMNYKVNVTEIKIFTNCGTIQNKELAMTTAKSSVKEMIRMFMEDDDINCSNITIKFLKSTAESKKIGDIIYSVLPAAFISAVSQAVNATISSFPLSRDEIFEILG